MSQFPHTYTVTVAGKPESSLTAKAENLPALDVAPPSQFGGPGDQWSPEALLMASVASCFVLSFRAIATASKLEWSAIECVAVGTLDSANRQVQFTDILTKAKLQILATENIEAARKALKKAGETCFISNSLLCQSNLECEIISSGD
ncbi:OsmC family protein [uncultured Amphritea sp.]|uniref:OsmC family protein n=1 Tax=uncultured Amphritea sp. TaxID=981605 RepID=UPI002621645E|nr:OsmC family protein [uncultured Amphritea sp.]